MGRHFEVRAAAMAATAAKKSAIYMRASKEIYMAAKNGTDPNSNLALRSAIEKYRKSTPKDVIERAIKKAAGGDATNYIAGRYEAYGPGNSYIIVDTLTDNVNRALVEVRTAITKKGGHLGTVSYNFSYAGILVFKGDEALRDQVEEALVLNDVDVKEVSYEEGYIQVTTAPEAFDAAKAQLAELEITDFDTAETKMVPNEYITLNEEDTKKFRDLLDLLDDASDVQAVYHNVELD